MSTLPKISIIMSVYNSEPYLSEAIDSILRQSFTDFEFIIINDGSTDSSLKILTDYKDERLVLINNICNIGLIKSLNKGILVAKGKYIARMDADDVCVKERLKIQYDYLEKHSDIFLVGSSFQYINDRGEKMSECVIGLNNEQIVAQFPVRNPIHHPTVMFRNEGKIYYREKALYCEDRDLWFRLSLAGKKFSIIKNILLQYRVHSSSESNIKKNLQLAFIEQINKWYLENKKYGCDTYDVFDVATILDQGSNDSNVTALYGMPLVKTREMKFLFKESNDMREFRKRARSFWREYGIGLWKMGYLYFFLSFMPTPVIKEFKKIIWK